MHYITHQEFIKRQQNRARRSVIGQGAVRDLDEQMLLAAQNGWRRDLASCLESGANPNAMNAAGKTGLFLTNQPGCVMTLLEGLADVLLEFEGKQPLIHHIEIGNIAIAQIMTKHVETRLASSVFEELCGPALEAGDRTWYAGTHLGPEMREWAQKTFGDTRAALIRPQRVLSHSSPNQEPYPADAPQPP